MESQTNLRPAISTSANIIVIGVVVIAGITSIYLLNIRGAGGGASPSVSTVTETFTYPCPTSIENQTTSQNSTSVN